MIILLVEDDPAHAEIVRRTFDGIREANLICGVTDGRAALDYLQHTGAYADVEKWPRPGLILLDLRLPKVSGLEVLRTVKSSEVSKDIPVVMLTTSASDRDIAQAYEHGANSYLIKPVGFDEFRNLMKSFICFWLQWNQYPVSMTDAAE